MKFRFIAIFVIIIFSFLILVSGCMNFGGNIKISDLHGNWDKYNGTQVTVLGLVKGYDSGFPKECEDTINGDSWWVDKMGYTLADDTGEIGISTCNHPNIGDEVRVTGIFYKGIVAKPGVQSPRSAAFPLGISTGGSAGLPDHIKLLDQTTTKKISNVNIPNKATVIFFYGNDCVHCLSVKPFIQDLSNKYPEVDFHNIEVFQNQKNSVHYKSLNKNLGLQNYGVPEVIVVGNATPLIGSQDIPANLEGVIIEQLKK